VSTLSLLEKFNAYVEGEFITKEIPNYISKNVNQDFDIRPYQIEGLSRFIYYMNEYRQRIKPTHLLFHMATGSGKTLMMAGAIIELYKLGYRNFIFFVDNTNIIEKTKINFLEPESSKYLFAQNIDIDGKTVRINEVSNFEVVNSDEINILFTTIQGLHLRLNAPKENSITYEDFETEKVVLISDEAHHINTLTKARLNKTEQQESTSWESSVQKILQANSENVLLEYTATLEVQHPAVNEKYKDKIVFEYTLKDFRIDKYSKEVQVLQADLSANDRVLQAVLLSQYRKKVAQRNGVFLKPVVLIKSKTIDSSKEYFNEFQKLINDLTPDSISELQNKTDSSVLSTVLSDFASNGISLDNLVVELKADFNQSKCIAVNSLEDSQEKQLIVNSLEDRDNPVRVVFVVDKLNEGWDVLNLFDIVRIDESRGSDSTTISEAQLIGRGARYFPFQVSSTQEKYKRKYDEDTGNELRILEELYYHSINNTRYISELRNALIQVGILPTNRIEVNLKVKPSFKETPFWTNGLIYTNERVVNDREGITNFYDIDITRSFKYVVKTGYSQLTTILDSGNQVLAVDVKEKTYHVKDLGFNVCKKAINKIPFYKFNNLKKYFPHLKSIKEFISADEFLAQIIVEVKGEEAVIESLPNDEKLKICLFILEKLAVEIDAATSEYKGTSTFTAISLSEKLKDVTLNISVNDNPASDQQRGKSMKYNHDADFALNLDNKAWYVYDDNFGTSEEKYLVKYIDNMMSSLEEKYDEVYLIRNEKMFQIYNFIDGNPVEPDYIMYLKDKDSEVEKFYQLFIEPKGTQLLEHDAWKEDFLVSIKENYVIETLIETEKYNIIGLPFYNEANRKREFAESFSEQLRLDI
jgi:type III restriction enzyme